LFFSLAYLAVRWLLQLVLLRRRSEEFKELEIVVLRHELAVLRRQPVRVRQRALQKRRTSALLRSRGAPVP
jgi:putative transposase